MGDKRILIIGAGRVGLGIAALLAARNFEATVLQVDGEPRKQPEPMQFPEPPCISPSPANEPRRQRAQWKSEIHGRRKP